MTVLMLGTNCKIYVGKVLENVKKSSLKGGFLQVYLQVIMSS